MYTFIWPSNSLLGLSVKDVTTCAQKVYQNISHKFIIIKDWHQPKYLWTRVNEWQNKLVYIHTMEYQLEIFKNEYNIY